MSQSESHSSAIVAFKKTFLLNGETGGLSSLLLNSGGCARVPLSPKFLFKHDNRCFIISECFFSLFQRRDWVKLRSFWRSFGLPCPKCLEGTGMRGLEASARENWGWWDSSWTPEPCRRFGTRLLPLFGTTSAEQAKPGMEKEEKGEGWSRGSWNFCSGGTCASVSIPKVSMSFCDVRNHPAVWHGVSGGCGFDGWVTLMLSMRNS